MLQSFTMVEKPHLSRRQFLKKTLTVGAGIVGGTALVGGSLAFGMAIVDSVERPYRERDSALESFGLTNPHELIDLKQIPGFEISGTFTGKYFLFGGTANGSIEGGSASFVQFAWKADPDTSDYYITQIPVEKVRFHTVEEVVSPTVRFEFDTKKVRYDDTINNNNPNDFINAAQIAVITLSEQDFTSLQ